VKESAPAPTEGAATPPPPEAVWKVSGEKGSKAVQIGQLVEDLHGLKGYEVAAEKPEDLAKYALAEPQLTFSLIDASGKPIGRILAGQAGEAATPDCYAMAEGGEVVYRVRSYLYSHLDKQKADFLETPPEATPSPAAAATP